MSNNWQLHCKTCDQTCEEERNWGHEEYPKMVSAIGGLESIIQLRTIAQNLWTDCFVDLMDGQDELKFIVEHCRHEIVLKSEYAPNDDPKYADIPLEIKATEVLNLRKPCP